ncbi:MAG: polymer-forming cytoskeletal protein [Anaerolineae bacterium]
MFRKEKSSKAPPIAPVSALETTIGPNTYFRGDLQSDGGIRIQGIFEGTIDITGNLVITDGAKVIADVSANNISISGAVKGNINGNRVEILETGRVWGDLTINSLLLNEGAYLRGQTTMHSDIEPPLIEAPRSKSAAKPASATIVDVEPKPQTTPQTGQ